MNQLVYVDSLSAIYTLMFGSAPTFDGALALYVSFAPIHWDGIRPPTELA